MRETLGAGELSFEKNKEVLQAAKFCFDTSLS